MEKLIVILGLLLVGTAVFASETAQIIPDNNPVVVTRKQQPKKEAVIQPEKKITKSKPTTLKTVKRPTNKQNKTVYTGLTIYKTSKPKQIAQVQKKKTRCIDDPRSICNTRRLKPAEPFFTYKAPRYSRTYSNRYRKSRLLDYPPLKLARPIPITTCY